MTLVNKATMKMFPMKKDNILTIKFIFVRKEQLIAIVELNLLYEFDV